MFMRYMRLSFVMLFGIASLAACNTIEGAGDDVESVGDAVSDTARDAND